MKKTTDLVKVIALFAQFPVNEIDKAYNKRLQIWLYKNSHEQEPLTEDKDGIKRFKFDVNGNITNVSFSGKTKKSFDLLEQVFINETLKKIKSVNVQNLDLDNQEYIAFLKSYFENKEVKSKEAKAIETIKNNFDDTPIERVCEYFKKNLVDTNHLKEDELNCYLKLAFDQQEKPTERFKLNHKSRKKIKGIFYNYYKEVAGKPHGRLEEYLNLLKDYFIGFETEDYTNFSKIY